MGSATLQMASIGLSALGTSNADNYQAQAMDRSAQYGELKATQTNAQLTRNMSMTLANMDAVRAAAHTSPMSPTGAAVRGQVEDQLTNQKSIQVNSLDAQAQLDEANASYLRSQGQMALLTGGVGMANSLMKSVSDMPGLSSGTP